MVILSKGFLEKEIAKEQEIQLNEANETCDAPKPKEMIDLEVNITVSLFFSSGFADNSFLCA